MKKKNYIQTAKNVISSEIEGLKKLQKSLDKNFNTAVEKIIKTSNRNGKICFIGLGKSGIVAERSSKTFSSISVPSIFIHAAEFSHGDSGVIQKNDQKTRFFFLFWLIPKTNDQKCHVFSL